MNFLNVLTDEQISNILNDPEVLNARVQLQHQNTHSFSIKLTDDIKSSIYEILGLDLYNVDKIPMRWIKEDTLPHIDVGSTEFDHTFLIYLQDDPGQLIIDQMSFSIQKGTGFKFAQNLSHATINTSSEPRLLIGPMNEFGLMVGGSVTFYYLSESDAINNPLTSYIAQFGTYIIQSVPYLGTTYSNWYIASNSTGPSPQGVLYNAGDVLSGDFSPSQVYYLYPGMPCFLEGSTILCENDNYIPIEKIEPGTLVKTHQHGYKRVELIGTSEIYNNGNDERTENKLYILKKDKYPELKEDLIVTGHHSILVDKLTDIQRKKIITSLGKIYITGNKYRLMTFADERAEPYKADGKFKIWHFALENTCIYSNYGVYANGGLLVESTSIRYMRDLSNMKLKRVLDIPDFSIFGSERIKCEIGITST